MRTVIGLALDSTNVRALVLRGETIVAAMELEIDTDQSAASAIVSLLSQLPISRWSSPMVYAVVGPAAAQVKQLAGVPALQDAEMQSSMVREGAGRLFLKNGIPLVTTSASDARGVLWGAALDEPAVRAIEKACSQSRLRLGAIAPSVATLGAALENERIVWRDGDFAAEVVREGDVTASVRRIPAGALPVQTPRPVPALAHIADDAWRFADAYGAAVAGHHRWLAMRDESGAAAGKRARLIGAATFAAVMIASAVIAPGMAAVWVRRDSDRQLAALAATTADAVRREQLLGEVTAALDEVARFGGSRPRATAILASLAKALPQGAAITSLKLDSTALTITVVATSITDVVARLTDAQLFQDVAIVGAVTRESVGAEAMERATMSITMMASNGAVPAANGSRANSPVPR